MARGCVLEIYRATFCGHLVDCWNTETGVTGAVHGCFTFFWAGDARVSAQDLNCDFYLYNDAIHPLIWTHFTVGSSGGPHTFHISISCLYPSTQIHRSSMCRSGKLFVAMLLIIVFTKEKIGGAPLHGTWRQSEIPVVMYRMRTDKELGH